VRLEQQLVKVFWKLFFSQHFFVKSFKNHTSLVGGRNERCRVCSSGCGSIVTEVVRRYAQRNACLDLTVLLLTQPVARVGVTRCYERGSEGGGGVYRSGQWVCKGVCVCVCMCVCVCVRMEESSCFAVFGRVQETFTRKGKCVCYE